MSLNKTGIELIAEERQEQLTKHGRTIELDIENNTEGQLSEAASILCLQIPEGFESQYVNANSEYPPIGWSQEWWVKTLKKSNKDRLIIAGALIAAELDKMNAEAKTVVEAILKENLV
jgi:hypothetical protein